MNRQRTTIQQTAATIYHTYPCTLCCVHETVTHEALNTTLQQIAAGNITTLSGYLDALKDNLRTAELRYLTTPEGTRP